MVWKTLLIMLLASFCYTSTAESLTTNAFDGIRDEVIAIRASLTEPLSRDEKKIASACDKVLALLARESLSDKMDVKIIRKVTDKLVGAFKNDLEFLGRLANAINDLMEQFWDKLMVMEHEIENIPDSHPLKHKAQALAAKAAEALLMVENQADNKLKSAALAKAEKLISSLNRLIDKILGS